MNRTLIHTDQSTPDHLLPTHGLLPLLMLLLQANFPNSLMPLVVFSCVRLYSSDSTAAIYCLLYQLSINVIAHDAQRTIT